LLVYIYLNPIAIVISSFVLLNFKHMNTGQAVQPSAAETKKATRRWVSDNKYCHGKKVEVNEQYDPLHLFIFPVFKLHRLLIYPFLFLYICTCNKR
jgi:NADH:ubiquinone oxidoreductase subunit 3 (subunit A)